MSLIAKGSKADSHKAPTKASSFRTLAELLRGMPARFRSTWRERFLRRVHQTDGSAGCWLWTGAKTSKGYGLLSVNGTLIRAHRLAFLIANGGLESDRYVLHRCDVRNCVNPAHLFAGTAADNTADMLAKNRQSSRLSPDDVHELRARFEAGEPARAIAAHFGVAEETIRQAAQGKTWSHLQTDRRAA